MAESWTDKTVSMDNVDKEEFDGGLAHVTVSENGITVGFKDVDDWKRIQREVGDDLILREVRWEAVDDVDTEIEHLYYPHIDIETVDREQRIYFLEDETELLEDCVTAIHRFWTAYRGAGAGSGIGYSYENNDDTGDQTGDEVEIEASNGERPEDSPDSGGDEAEEEGAGSLEEDAMEIVEEFIED